MESVIVGVVGIRMDLRLVAVGEGIRIEWSHLLVCGCTLSDCGTLIGALLFKVSVAFSLVNCRGRGLEGNGVSCSKRDGLELHGVSCCSKGVRMHCCRRRGQNGVESVAEGEGMKMSWLLRGL